MAKMIRFISSYALKKYILRMIHFIFSYTLRKCTYCGKIKLCEYVKYIYIRWNGQIKVGLKALKDISAKSVKNFQ